MKDFLAALDTPGGHMFSSIFLLIVSFFVLFTVDKVSLGTLARDVGLIAIGGLGVAMKGQNGGRMTITPPPAPPTEPPKP